MLSSNWSRGVVVTPSWLSDWSAEIKVFSRFLARISLGVIWAKLSCLYFVPPVMSRSIALTTSSHKLRDSSSLEYESVPPLQVEFSVNQEQNAAPAARCSVSSSGLSVKNTECWDVVRLQLGWFINQACPNDVDDEFHTRSFVAHDFVYFILSRFVYLVEKKREGY